MNLERLNRELEETLQSIKDNNSILQNILDKVTGNNPVESDCKNEVVPAPSGLMEEINEKLGSIQRQMNTNRKHIESIQQFVYDEARTISVVSR